MLKTFCDFLNHSPLKNLLKRNWSGSEKVLKYLAEKYDLLIGADGFLNDAGHQTHLDAGDRARLAIEEMLAYKDVYGWSEEFVTKLEERTT